MCCSMGEDREVLREIRGLWRLVAEPAIGERDERVRTELRQIGGKSKQKADAVALMNGMRSQAAIRKECGIDGGDLSRLVKALKAGRLIGPDDDPKLTIPLPPNLLSPPGDSKA